MNLVGALGPAQNSSWLSIHVTIQFYLDSREIRIVKIRIAKKNA